VARIFGGCVTALGLNYAVAAMYCAVMKSNGAGAVAHVLVGLVLMGESAKVDLGSELAIKKFYMLIWKCFYAEYLVLLLL
jgi:hypothetical protein